LSKNFSSLSLFSSISPNKTISTAILFFFNSLPAFSSSLSVASIGLPTKATIRWTPFLFLRCFRASWWQKESGSWQKKATCYTCATCIESMKFAEPVMLTPGRHPKSFPISSVGDTKTSGLSRVSRN
jgi:hypothetical protein